MRRPSGIRDALRARLPGIRVPAGVRAVGRGARRLAGGGPRWWHRMDGLQRALLLGAAGLLLACLWIVSPIGDPALPEAGAGPPIPEVPRIGPPASPGSPAEVQALVERNPFSGDRKAPEERWTLASEEEEARQAREPPPHTRYRLLGTVVRGTLEGSFAVIEADPATEGPEIYHFGDAVGPYKLRRIFYDRVVLTRDGQEVELEFPPAGAGQSGAVARSPQDEGAR